EDNQRTLLSASSALALWYLRKEEAERRLVDLAQEREQVRQHRHQRLEQTQSIRSNWRTLQEQAHARELQVNEQRHKREALCARLQEDYQLDLAALYQEQAARLESGSVPEEPAADHKAEAAPSERGV